MLTHNWSQPWFSVLTNHPLLIVPLNKATHSQGLPSDLQDPKGGLEA